MMSRRHDVALALSVALGCTGCTQWIGTGGAPRGAMYEVVGDSDPLGAEETKELAGYVSYMDTLAAIDEQSWNGMFAQASKATASSPTSGNRLRLALVLSRPDRPAGDLHTARDLLIDLLEGDAAVPAAVRKMARVKLAEIERRIALYETASSLRTQLAMAKNELLNAKRDRTRAERERARVEEEVQRIQSALADALAKLEAVTNIERSVERSQNEAPIP